LEEKIMLKAFAEYLSQRPAPNTVEHGGKLYSDKQLFPVSNPNPDCLSASTLKAIVDYITHDVDASGVFKPERFIIHIVSPSKVILTSECVSDGNRWDRVVSEAIAPRISFGSFMDTEIFNITLQSMFVNSEGRAAVLSVVGNITDGAVKGFTDDGVTQQVNIKAGIQRVGTETVPNPVMLAPFRTFAEVEQPVSPFVLRLQPGRSEGSMPNAALFEADGAAWRLEAIDNIRRYFEDALADLFAADGRIVIIA
jgi:hypothetical protein